MTAMAFHEVLAAARRHPRRFVETTAHHDPQAVVIRLIEPELLNPLSPPLLVQLRDALRAAIEDPSAKSVILTGTDPGFCVGGDFRIMQNAIDAMRLPVDEGAVGVWRFIRQLFGTIARTIVSSDKPVIAAVNGATAGVGWAFMLACDHIICSQEATIVPAFARLGLVPEVGTSWLLTRTLGYHRALELYSSGTPLTGSDCANIGLAQAVVAHDQLLPAALDRAQRYATLPDHAFQMAKPLLRQAADMTWDQSVTMEEFAEPLTFTTTHFRDTIAQLSPPQHHPQPGWPPADASQ